MKRFAVALLAAVAMGSATFAVEHPAPQPAPSPDLVKAIEGRSAGPAERCIDGDRQFGLEVVDARHIVYRQTGRRLWVNTLPEACLSRNSNDILVFDNQYGTQLCEFDRFRTVSRNGGIPGGYCRLGRFTPYDKPDRKGAKPPR